MSSMEEVVGAELFLTETNLVRFALNYSRPSVEDCVAPFCSFASLALPFYYQVRN